jgi:rhamnosyl/mannosyltransferase
VITSSLNYIETSPVLSAYRERCRVIPYGIPIEQFHRYDTEAVAKIRAQYGPRMVLSVGRLIYYKGFEYLIQAMARVEGRLLIVGEGPLRADLERKTQSYKLGDRVVFLGGVQDVVPYYHAADVFVLASTARSEAFGIVQLEAMACGKPVVNTRLDSGVPSVSVDGVTGLTVPPAHPEALARAINLLLDDPGLRANYGRAARRRVQEEFSLDLMISRTLRLYTEVMGSPIERQAIEYST